MYHLVWEYPSKKDSHLQYTPHQSPGARVVAVVDPDGEEIELGDDRFLTMNYNLSDTSRACKTKSETKRWTERQRKTHVLCLTRRNKTPWKRLFQTRWWSWSEVGLRAAPWKLPLWFQNSCRLGMSGWSFAYSTVESWLVGCWKVASFSSWVLSSFF